MASAGATVPEHGLQQLAERIVDGAEPVPADVADDFRLHLAWALKDACYASWSTEPQRTARAAEALRALSTGGTTRGEAGEVAALAQWTAGIAHLTRGEMTAAIACFADAAERFRALGKPHEAAQAEVPIVMALTMLGRHEEAVASANRTRRTFMQHGDERAAAKVSLNLGSLELRRDEYAHAARHYTEAAVLFARGGDHERSIMADIGIGDARTALGEFDEALRIYARAGMRAAAHGFPVLEAIRDESVGLLELARGRYREALAGLERSRSRYESLMMPQHLAIAEKQLGDAYLELRLLPEALALYERAIVKFEQQAAPDDLAWTFAQLGRTQALLGQPEAAAASLARGAAMFAAQGNAVGESAVTLARAEVALAFDDAASALPLAEKATEGFLRAELPERRVRAEAVWADAQLRSGTVADARRRFATTLGHARQLGLLQVQVRCLTGEGLAALAAGDGEAARRAFDAAVGLFEEQRRVLPGDDIRTAFLTDHLVPYRELMRMALNEHTRAPTAETAANVLYHVERVRARALAERLAHRIAYGDDAATRDLRAHIAWLQRRLQRAYDDGARSTELAAELGRCERELLERARRQRLVAPALTKAAADESLDLRALREALGEADAIVEYGVLDDELFACVVRHRGIVVRRAIAHWSDTISALRSARFQIETLRHGGGHLTHRLDALADRARVRLAQLYGLVWQPLAPALAGCARVLVVAHGELGAVPFAALHSGSHYVVEQFEIASAPSARLALRSLACASAAARSALVIGVGDRVPHAVREASLVAGLFPGARTLLGAEATIDAVAAAGCEADVIHFACHAQFRRDNPMFSALHLHDGALSVEMVERLRLRASVVALSACETALAEHSTGDEMVGLVRAFLVAGATRVVASLWPVDDAVTSRTMSEFYAALRKDRTPGAALRAAQRQTMLRHPHPYFWGAFTLYGGW